MKKSYADKVAVKRSLDVLPAGLHVAQSIIFHGKLVG